MHAQVTTRKWASRAGQKPATQGDTLLQKKNVKCVTAKEDRYKQKMEAYISHLRETTPKGIFKVIFNWSISNGRVESTMKEMQDIR